MKRVLIIYHKEDNDGVFSCAIIYDYLKRTYNNIYIDTLPATYNTFKEIDDLTLEVWEKDYDHIIMTDISDSIILKKLHNIFNDRLIWIDHHAPVIKESENFGFDIQGCRKTDRSAILCAYNYFYDQFDLEYIEGTINRLYVFLSAYDSFTWDNHNLDKDYCIAVNKAVTFRYNINLDNAIAVVEALHEYSDAEIEAYIFELYKEGKKLNEYDEQNWNNIINNYGDCSWTVNGRSACTIFLQGSSTSLMFKSLTDKNILNGIVFKYLKDGNWVMSLYNINDTDTFHCGEYLKQNYKGGGHKGAAGCTVTQKQFINILKNKKI